MEDVTDDYLYKTLTIKQETPPVKHKDKINPSNNQSIDSREEQTLKQEDDIESDDNMTFIFMCALVGTILALMFYGIIHA